LPTDLLNRLPPARKVRASQVDHLLAIIRPDQTATVYVNELTFSALIRANCRRIEAFQPVSKDDIADILELDPVGVVFPGDAGVVFVFSQGWRKGLFYDLSPLTAGAAGRRTTDLRALLGQFYTHLLFQERFSILDTEWDRLLATSWFPFIALSCATIDKLLCHLRAGWNLDELTSGIAQEVRGKLPSLLEAWRGHPAFTPHMAILDRAAERFQAGDFVSCTGLLFPRIEGILRSNHAAAGVTTSPSQGNLCASAVRANTGRERCLLLPHMFERYLRGVYFADFRPADPDNGVSRHSVGHGVASPALFSEKAATIGLLVAHQLFFCFEPPQQVASCSTEGGSGVSS
jgi:hypothetical protein